MKTSTTTLKTSWAVSWKTEHTVTIQPSNCTPEHLSQREKNTCVHTSLCMIVHNSFIFNSPKLEVIKCSSLGEWLNKLYYIHSMEFFSAIRGTHYQYTPQLGRISRALCWMRKQSQKVSQYDSIYITFSKWQITQMDNWLLIVQS